MHHHGIFSLTMLYLVVAYSLYQLGDVEKDIVLQKGGRGEEVGQEVGQEAGQKGGEGRTSWFFLWEREGERGGGGNCSLAGSCPWPCWQTGQ